MGQRSFRRHSVPALSSAPLVAALCAALLACRGQAASLLSIAGDSAQHQAGIRSGPQVGFLDEIRHRRPSALGQDPRQHGPGSSGVGSDDELDPGWQQPALSREFPLVTASVGGGIQRRSPGTFFSSRFQKLRRNFDFAWWCNNTWQCHENPDRSVTLNTYWDVRAVGFGSLGTYLYGTFSVDMKIPLGNSEGMYHTFYLIQDGDIPQNDSRHAEIDIEFYGAKDPKDTVIATNIIAGGYQMLQQHRLPFNPAKKYHSYSITWGPRFIIWWVDATPIRVTHFRRGRPWPRKPLKLIATSWQQGTADYIPGPISLQYQNIRYMACPVPNPKRTPATCLRNANHPWARWNRLLTRRQQLAMYGYRRKHLITAWDWGLWDGPANVTERGGGYRP